MKNFKRLLAVAFSLALIVALSGFISTDNNAADVIKENGCVVSTPWGGAYTTDDITVLNYGENVMLTCHFKDVFNPSGMVYKDEGFACNTWGGLTYDSRKVITPSGNAMLKCMIKKPKD
jgi:hypothetical protein